MPKCSRYNYFLPWQNGYNIAYNAATGAVALMTDEHKQMYDDLLTKLQKNGDTSLTEQESELVKQLQYGGFLKEDHIDEIQQLKYNHFGARFNTSALGLVIAPTMACNMACAYCYEGNKAGKMSAETIETLIRYVEKEAPHLTELDVTWYGGEPLLALDVIEDLSETFMDLAKESEFSYVATMVTNGYLLTPEVVDKLKSWRVGMVQVTLDGPARLHDRKRPLKNGKESFQTIIDNLKMAVGKIAVGVRVNVDHTFTPEIVEELLFELIEAGLRDKVGVYFGLLEPATKTCSNIAESCMDNAEFSRIETDFYKLLLNHGFRIEKLPSPNHVFCMAQAVGAAVIDPEGNTYRCWHHVGDPDRASGNIRSVQDQTDLNFMRLFSFDPFEQTDCRECKLLPVCLGGCPSRRADRDFSNEEMCESWKYNLSSMLEIIAASRYQAVPQPAKEQV
jgi:uncharacterized protein